jgi:hypothetical protein
MIDQSKNMHLILPMLLQGIAYLYTFANLQKNFITLLWQFIQNSIYRIFTIKRIGKNSNNICNFI